MAGIAGIAKKDAVRSVSEMLDKMHHRGRAGRLVFETGGVTLGVVWNESESAIVKSELALNRVGYNNGPGHLARAEVHKGTLHMYRDELGVAPLYYGRDGQGNICFSSEVKALLPLTPAITELPPGKNFDGYKLISYFKLNPGPLSDENPDVMARRLRRHLDEAVDVCIRSENIGSWLSGGLDSSTICALAAAHLKKLKTFAAGLKGAPDLEFAREVAHHVRAEHHEVIITEDAMIRSLPKVIYHLESFDALLVRSSITNFLVAERASDHVSQVFSGEGGDELFAGYEYLKSIPETDIEAELVKITCNLHNTALQRVDRSASAHGTIAHVIFANPDVVRFAFTIPVRYKIKNNIEKWILRRAMKGALPDRIIDRPKVKFWEGAGVKDIISVYADKQIKDSAFQKERRLPNGWIINTKEELLYYRIFKDHFGKDINLSWMGRTERSPVTKL